ncbi:hypothetical protein FQA39_LY12396 [Lamprigera yunnana]|nr:hypothetical protein FQA39_LY12396 [Lamprigera yunnana]
MQNKLQSSNLSTYVLYSTAVIQYGIRVDGEKEIQKVIDHLTTESHIAADNLEKMQHKWLAQSDEHPWVKISKFYNAEKIKILIKMAVDVYNDSRQLTLNANFWPSRTHMIYVEMSDIEGGLFMKNVKEQLEEADCFAIQGDGSVDKYGVDNKCESKSQKRGAEGLLEAIKILFEDLNIDKLAKEKTYRPYN